MQCGFTSPHPTTPPSNAEGGCNAVTSARWKKRARGTPGGYAGGAGCCCKKIEKTLDIDKNTNYFLKICLRYMYFLADG
jgi:hypothetical protein